eukprot:sb/3474908/
MISRVAATRSLLPQLSCVRNLRAKPDYYNPADADPVADNKFDVEFGITEDKTEAWESKNEWFAKYIDPFYKAKAYIGKAFGADLYHRQSAEELAERAEMTERLHEFYRHIPQKYPDAEWWNDCIDHYVKLVG